MNKKQIIQKTEAFIKAKFAKDTSGHDWWHIYRVRTLATYIAKREKADLFIVELSALLHDLDDWKLNTSKTKLTQPWLNRLGLDRQTQQLIMEIVNEVSFKGALVKSKMKTLEGKIVQDADKLDAIGAIGIGRTFAFGAKIGVPLYNPNHKPKYHKSFAEYKKNDTDTINHFYEKLLLLKDRMHTKTAKKIAIERHKFMETYLKQFFREWQGIE